MKSLRISTYDMSLYERRLPFPNDLPTAVIYLRVSTEKQSEEGHSLELQETRIREACDRRL